MWYLYQMDYYLALRVEEGADMYSIKICVGYRVKRKWEWLDEARLWDLLVCFRMASLTSTLALRDYQGSLNEYADVEQAWDQTQQGATTCTYSSRKNHLGGPYLDHVIFTNTPLTVWASRLWLKPQYGGSCYEAVLWSGSLEGNGET